MHSVGHQKGFVPSSIAETNDKPLLGRDSKQIVPPIYGCDISSLESTTDSTKLASTDLTMHGVKLHLTEGMKQSYDKCTIDSSCNLATFLLHYPAIVQLSVPPKEIIIECGPGFSGIAALHLGYQNVMFAATSADIVRNALWPNIILNCTGTCEVAHARCIASSNSVALSEYLSDPGPNKWTVIYKQVGLVLFTVSSIHNHIAWEQLHSLLLRHLTGTGMALVGLHAAIAVDTPLPVPPYLRQCFEHSLLQSPACEGTPTCDIVRITRRQSRML